MLHSFDNIWTSLYKTNPLAHCTEFDKQSYVLGLQELVAHDIGQRQEVLRVLKEHWREC